MGLLYLAISDGTTTCTIADGSGGAVYYKLAYGKWAPRVAKLRQDTLGGRGPYTDETEEMLLNIHGATAADAYAKLQTLMQLIDQVKRWKRGETGATAVLLKYSPANATISSAASPLQATLLDGDVVLPGHFNAGDSVITGVKLTVKRLGEWLHTTDSKASAATSNGDKASVAMTGAITWPGPTKIQVEGVVSQAQGVDTRHYLALADTVNGISIFNAEDAASSAPWSSVNESAQYARNTNVLRYTPADTSEHESGAINIALAGANALPDGLMAIYACVRNNSSTGTTFRIRIRCSSRLYTSVYTTPKVIGAIATPRWVCLGLISAEQWSNAYINIAASAAADSLDIDTLVFVSQAVNTAVVSFTLSNGSGAAASGDMLEIDHKLLTAIAPKITTNAVIAVTQAYDSDAVVALKAATVYALVMATGGASSLNRWRQEASAAVNTNVITLVRHTAYLTPV